MLIYFGIWVLVIIIYLVIGIWLLVIIKNMLLSLSTATPNCALALIDKQKVVAEISWPSRADESAKILPAISRLLKKHSFFDLKNIGVISGPGSYTRLRIGITIANALAYSLKIPVASVDTFSLFVSPLQNLKTGLIFLPAGGDHVYLKIIVRQKNKIKASKVFYGSLESALKKAKKTKFDYCAGDLPPEKIKLIAKTTGHIWLKPKDLLTFGQIMIKYLDLKKSTKSVLPNYIQPPKITIKKMTK